MSFSGVTQSAENSDFQEVDEVRQKKKNVHLFGSTMRVIWNSGSYYVQVQNNYQNLNVLYVL
jgi:hypothetical protein